jgi:hypothetical protein
MYLIYYQNKIGLKAQTPTNESTKQDFYCKSLVFFSFSPQLYSDLSFLAKLSLEYAEQAPYYRYWIKDLDLMSRLRCTCPQCRKFFVKSNFFLSFSSWELRWPWTPFSLICWTNFILQLLNQKFSLIAQISTHESTKQEIFLQILDIFFFFHWNCYIIW